MTVRWGLLQKKPDWSDADFRAYWLERHSLLAKQLPGLRGYRQNHVVDARQLGIAHRRGPWHFDGFSQLSFDDDAGMQNGLATDIGPRLVRDEAHFIGPLHIVATECRTVVEPPPRQGRLLKRISLLTRPEGMSEATFRHEWTEVHAGLVQRMPGIRGYRQNVVGARQRVKGTPCGHDELPIDGIVELWFDDVPGIEAAFASPAGVTTMAHAATFIADITAFLVQERVIV